MYLYRCNLVGELQLLVCLARKGCTMNTPLLTTFALPNRAQRVAVATYRDIIRPRRNNNNNFGPVSWTGDGCRTDRGSRRAALDRSTNTPAADRLVFGYFRTKRSRTRTNMVRAS